VSASKTPTGRKPTSKPNLQNIPLNTPEGRRIRDAFNPSFTDTGRFDSSKPAKSNTPKGAAFTPEFTGAIEGWVVNFLTKNLWRVARTMDRDDCMQEAQLVFLRVKRTYPGVTDAPHFMALFKTSWTRRFDDLSTDDSVIREAEVHYDNSAGREEDAAPVEFVGDVENEGELRVMLRQAPREVTMVLNLLLKAPQEMLDVLLGGWKGRDKRMKGGGSEHINRLLGLPEQQDTLQRVQDYFRHGTHGAIPAAPYRSTSRGSRGY
jgi:hypothetical protein